MKEKHIGASVFIDSEDCRDKAVRYLTGHPSDALVILTAEGKSFLVPWDINLAEEKAHADTIIPVISSVIEQAFFVHQIS